MYEFIRDGAIIRSLGRYPFTTFSSFSFLRFALSTGNPSYSNAYLKGSITWNACPLRDISVLLALSPSHDIDSSTSPSLSTRLRESELTLKALSMPTFAISIPRNLQPYSDPHQASNDESPKHETVFSRSRPAQAPSISNGVDFATGRLILHFVFRLESII